MPKSWEEPRAQEPVREGLEDLKQGGTSFDVYSWTIAWVLRGKGRSKVVSEGILKSWGEWH